MRRIFALLILLCCSTPLAFAADSQTSAWKKIILQCAGNEQIAKQQIHYMGASNQIGPGSIWQRNADNGLDFYYPFATILPSASTRDGIIEKGEDVGCTGSNKSGWNLKLGLPFASAVVPISGDLQVQLSHAKNITISIDGYAIDTIALGNWSDAIAALPPDSHHVRALDGRYLAKSGIRVRGMKTTFQFDHDLSVDVQAKFQNADIVLGSGTGATLHAELSGSRQITISAPGTSYILIDLGKITNGSNGAEADSVMSSDAGPTGSTPAALTVIHSDLPADVHLGAKPE